MTEVAGHVPFVGLRPFDLADADWFFGREREATRLTRKIRASPFTAVVGASGSGKSSLVRAGVLPKLRKDGWREVVTKPGSAPIAHLAAKLAELGSGSDDRLAEARRYRYDALQRASAFGLAEIVEKLTPEAPRLILVIDQFEELFRYGEEARGAEQAAMHEEGRAFVELLLTAARREGSRLHVVLTMRSDYFGNCAGYRGLAEAVSDAQFLVPMPERDQLEVAIREPLRRAGIAIEDGLVQRLLVDAEEQTDRLPLLQHTLRRLWETAKVGAPTLRERDYMTVGGMAGSIDLKAEAILAHLSTTHPADAFTIERVMKALTALDDRDRAMRRPQRQSALLALVEEGSKPTLAGTSLKRVLAAYAAEDVSFLQLGEGADPEVDIGHEALIRSWKRLAGECRDFKSGWPAEERADGEGWRFYVGRAIAMERLTFTGQLQVRRWISKRHLGPIWSERYGNAWEAVDQLLRRSLRASTIKAGCVMLAAVIIGVFGWRLSSDNALARVEALRAARLGAISLADRAWLATESGNARAGALLARAALPPVAAPSPDDDRYVAQAAASLAYALAGKPVEVLRLVHQDGVYGVAFSPDGKRLASASSDKAVRLWDAATGQPIGAPLEGHQDSVLSVVFSPDGKRLASTSSDTTVRLWDAAIGQPIGAPLEGHQDIVWSVAFSPDGKRLASASSDKTVRLWDAATGQPIGAPLEGHQDRVLSVAFSSDGKRLASASADKTVRLWDAATGQPIGAPLEGHQDMVWSVAFSPDGKRLASASADKTVRLWDALSGQPIGAPLEGHQDRVWSVAFSPDGKRLASASADKTVRLWDALSGQPIGAPLEGHQDRVLSVAFSPDGKRLASASSDTTVRLWDAATGQPIGAPLEGHQDIVWSVAFSPDGKRLASASSDTTVRLWDAATGQPIGAPLEGHQDIVWSVAFSPDGKRLASASSDKTVRLWDAATGQPIGAPLEGHQDRVLSVAFSPDGKRLASASSDKTVRLWDAATGQPIGAPLEGHQDRVWSVAFSPDGKRLASASWDKTVRLWDAAIGQPIGAPLEGHQDMVWSVAFSPDGKRLASASADETVRLWDAATGQPIGAPLEGHQDMVLSVAFSPDGKRLASASWDKTVRLWDLTWLTVSLPELVARAESLCPLSSEERSRFGLADPKFPDRPKDWTPAQRLACGLHGNVGGGEY